MHGSLETQLWPTTVLVIVSLCIHSLIQHIYIYDYMLLPCIGRHGPELEQSCYLPVR